MTPHGHLVRITKKLTAFIRHQRDPFREGRALDAYTLSGDFLESMGALNPQQRKKVLVMYSEALAACTPHTPPLPPVGTRRVKWDETTIRVFRHAYAKGGLEYAGRKLGLSADAARLAAKRHVLAATEHRSQAA